MRALTITHSITRREEKSLDRYLNEISRYEVLTPEEELGLFRQYRRGDESALSKIMLHNLRFVVSVAKQYQRMGLKLGDLINEGNIGLIKAAKRFDETKGFKFISYAVWWIRQSILQAVNEKSGQIRLPANVTGKSAKVQRKILEFLQDKEREPSIAEIAESTGLSKRAVKLCLQSYQKCYSLDSPVGKESDTPAVNMMHDPNIEDPDHKLTVRESQKIEVRELLKMLPEKQAKVLAMYYGIGWKQSMHLSDIGDCMGLTRERVRQIRDRALMKLRRRVTRSGAGTLI